MIRDVTLDEDLLNYLSHNELSGSQAINARIVKSAKYLSLDDTGRLWCTGTIDGPPR